MVQTAGSVACVAKTNKAFYNVAGTRVIGDGSTVAQVAPLEAANLAKAGSLVLASDIVILETDFEEFVRSLETKNRG